MNIRTLLSDAESLMNEIDNGYYRNAKERYELMAKLSNRIIMIASSDQMTIADMKPVAGVMQRYCAVLVFDMPRPVIDLAAESNKTELKKDYCRTLPYP